MGWLQELSNWSEDDAFLGARRELGDQSGGHARYDEAQGKSIAQHDNRTVYVFGVVYEICVTRAPEEYVTVYVSCDE